MVRSVARKLYELDGTVIEQMASNLEPFPTWASPVFAYDKAAIRNPVKLKKDADIYISTGYSAYDCICFIRALLKKYNLDIEEDFVYSARQNKGNEKELDRLEIAKEWCETRRAAGSICYDEVNSQRRYVRFTTPTLNSLIPESTEKLSPWKTKNFYFYEITNYKGEFFVQLYFYCQNLTKEMKDAFVRLSDICGLGDLAKGYKLSEIQTANYRWMLLQPFMTIDMYSMAAITPEQEKSLIEISKNLPKYLAYIDGKDFNKSDSKEKNKLTEILTKYFLRSYLHQLL